MIDQATIDKITNTARIEEVVSDFVTLRRAGVNLKGLCPFHDDRTPSFFVSPARNYCKCFSCGEGGNPVTFIMKHEQLPYADAMRYLGRKYGIPVEEKELSAADTQRRDDRESMFILNDWAREWFRKQLYETADGQSVGMAYLRSRGFRDDILEKFQVGYCPNSRQTSLWADALRAGFREEYIINAPNKTDTRLSLGTGLAYKRDNGHLRDRFAGRVIWPILTVSGKVAGFGGRVLDAATKGVSVKYLNSPESLIYSKRRELYGLYQAKQAISRNDLCYLVEGYTDVMAMHQSGVENVVSSSGTALTDEQIQLVRRLTDNIVVIYDGDAAGIKASQRGIDMLLRHGMNVRLLLLPDDEDPDSFARKHNAEEFKDYLTNHQTDFIKFKMSLLLEEAEGDPVALSRLVGNIVQSIAEIPDDITRSFYIREAAQTMNMREALIASAVNKQAAKNTEERMKQSERERRAATLASATPAQDSSASQTAGTPATAPDRFYLMEKELARAIVRYGHVVVWETAATPDQPGERLTATEYIDSALRQDGLELRTPAFCAILREALSHKDDEDFNAERYFVNHPERAISELAFSLATDKEQLSKLYKEENPGDPFGDGNIAVELVPHLITDYKLGVVKERLRALTEEMKDPSVAQDEERRREVMTSFMRLKEAERKLSQFGGDRVVSLTLSHTPDT